MKLIGGGGEPTLRRLLLGALTVVTVAAIANHVLAALIGVGIGATYRRIGPVGGPQVLGVGSSVLQYSLAWRDVSRLLGRGIEHTNVAGSTPEIWEVFQRQAANIDTTIVGISPYDLNEHRITRGYASFVPLGQTLKDLRESGTTRGLSRRVLAEYPLAYTRLLFPAVGNSDAVLVGVRRITRQTLGLSGASEDAASVLVLPKGPLLDFGDDSAKLSDLSRDRVLRRLSLLRAENRGLHAFQGLKQLALRRILARASQLGELIVVVAPVSNAYRHAFLPPDVVTEFEYELAEELKRVPKAVVVRLDRVPDLQSDDVFGDFVHLNGAGRVVATRVFAKSLKVHSPVARVK